MANKLAKYRSKRDFEKTQEPSGATAVRKAEYPRFVIQKHDASRLHYDLRLEHDGVFKSWAVTKGPSLDPKDKRLAVEVEDHPLDYGDFEGTIPKGEYGGGTVMLWDRGFWLPEGTDDIDAALRKGELKFVLAGDKLQGGWVLVRLKNDRDGSGKRNNWLLIKHKDEWSTQRRRGGDPQGQIRRLGPHDAADRRRQGQGADAVHAVGQARRRQTGRRMALQQERKDRRAPPAKKVAAKRKVASKKPGKKPAAKRAAARAAPSGGGCGSTYLPISSRWRRGLVESCRARPAGIRAEVGRLPLPRLRQRRRCRAARQVGQWNSGAGRRLSREQKRVMAMTLPRPATAYLAARPKRSISVSTGDRDNVREATAQGRMSQRIGELDANGISSAP